MTYSTTFVGYRAPRSAGGGLYNGYVTPKRKQDWTIGEVVNVGFIKGLEVIKKVGATYVLWQPQTNRFYSFRPHVGIVRCDSLAEALAQ